MELLEIDRGVTANIVTDSAVYQQGEGYERMMLVTGWHPNPKKLARVHIRVDRNPQASFAKTEVWAGDGVGWQPMCVIPVNEFWSDMPGYLRWSRDTSDAKTRQLMADLVFDLIELAESID